LVTEFVLAIVCCFIVTKKIFHVHYNLKKLPDSIGKLTNLRHLSAGKNELTKLPDSIGKLTNLERLFLEGNKLTSLPSSMNKLDSLTMLSLGGNTVTMKDVPPKLKNKTRFTLED
jgi:Leucine-rich repeat (LRR) protein